MRKKWIILAFLFGFSATATSCESRDSRQAKPITPKRVEEVRPTPEPIEPSVQAPFLWKVSHEKGDSYLLGTIHQSVRPDEVINEALYEKIDESRIVVFETDTKSMLESEAEVVVLSQLSKGQSLKKMLGKEYWKSLTELLKTIPEPALDRLKPWVVISILGLQEIQKLNLFLPRGMDDTLRRYAELQSRPIGFLEKWRDVVDDGERAMTAQSLREMLDEKADLQKEFLALRKNYLEGDEQKLLENFTAKTKSEEKFFEILIYKRNEKWLEHLVKFLNKGNAVIAVGAGHLVGENSIIDLLKARGFTVERVKSMTPSK